MDISLFTKFSLQILNQLEVQLQQRIISHIGLKRIYVTE